VVCVKSEKSGNGVKKRVAQANLGRDGRQPRAAVKKNGSRRGNWEQGGGALQENRLVNRPGKHCKKTSKEETSYHAFIGQQRRESSVSLRPRNLENHPMKKKGCARFQK